MDTKSLASMMGHSTSNFTDLTLQKDKFGFIARYLDDQEEESDLLEVFKSKPLVYGLIAMNWHIMYKKYTYEEIYTLLVKHLPETDEEFWEILSIVEDGN